MQHKYEYPFFARRMTGVIKSSNFYYFLSCLVCPTLCTSVYLIPSLIVLNLQLTFVLLCKHVNK
jgi:hypothetical protein